MTTTRYPLLWKHRAGFHTATLAVSRPGYTQVYEWSVQRTQLDDGAWWVVVYPDKSYSDPTQYLATAKRWVEDDAAGVS